MATKQKSIEDYRNAVKLLKLKVLKLQKQNEELIDKLREQGIPLDQQHDQVDLSNQAVMGIFSRSCRRVGLTPEMMFRASDREGQGQISTEDMRLFLSKVRLGLNNTQLTMLVRIFDEDCSGVIKREEYYDCLQAYGINEEKVQGQARTYGQESLLKYARLLLMNRLSVEDSLKKMGDNIIPSHFVSFIHGIDGQNLLNEKEIIAVFNHIDVNKSGVLQATFYDQEVRKAMRVAQSDIGLGVQINPNTGGGGGNPIPKPQPVGILKPSQISQQLDPFRMTQTQMGQSKSGLNMSSSHAFLNETIIMLTEEDKKNILTIITKLKAQGVDAIEFIKIVIQQLEVPGAGILLYDFYKRFDKKIPKSDQLSFFNAIDLNKNGSIDYDELMVFFQEFKSPKDNFDLLFEILTRKLQALEIGIVQHLASEQIYEDTQLNQEQFYQLAQILFSCPSKKHSDALFSYFDIDGSGILSAQEIIDQVQKILLIYVPQKTMNLDNTLNKSMRASLKSVGEYATTLSKLKPVLTEEDYFGKYRMEGSGKTLHKEETKWTTIFNSDLACLRYVYEEISKLEQNPGAKWEDPDFGPTKEDPYGSKSMYFADNDVPEGAPQPKECKWLRPEEFLAALVENGDEQYKNSTVDVFDEDGAASNDVCQSKYLGNCWFVSALSIISGYEQYLQGDFVITQESIQELTDEEVNGMLIGVYPPCFKFLRKYGLYVMRFFKNFGWKYVVIDDKLCVKDNEYVFGKNRKPTESWVNLIEKAYAKLHQNYFALTAGDIAQGLADMTGKVPDKIKLNEECTKAEKEDLWNLLLKCKKDGTMLGCSAEGGTELYIKINDEDTGVMSGHAYGILDMFEIPDQSCNNYHKSHRLLKIRNPWGYGEWKLKWSETPDYSAKLDKWIDWINDYYQKEIEKAKLEGKEPPEPYVYGQDDGTFFMCFKSWRTVFSNLFQCIDFPDDWSGLRAFDQFGLQSSGAPMKTEASLIQYAQKNPQYILELKRKKGDKTNMYIQMQQVDGRLFLGERYPFPNVMKPILLCVFSLGPTEKCLAKFDDKKVVASSGKLNLRREIDTNDISLSNGRYAVIPCTKEGAQQIDFTLSFYFDCDKSEINITKYGDPRFKLHPITEEEEEVSKVPEELKKLLKKQAQEVLSSQ
ncbi:unnamed protein product (macronuclear) [Paramecium tetraurelia]|uniref:Calpain family cysteine protease n=1 Tax=Paramecium tetraurelia TaxID=5888 RepID=A0E1K3_PARTE|nr:uncharacterized protein GSPATT00022340001 [Paramecium tetraurelia]CAK89170.1 unnamed protein product [Paramecium tetraurelia]|eukprot:XP_001456567.1 hypothetical protein (macronuclear) [Paramecium tetraurelia strain d4-2]